LILILMKRADQTLSSLSKAFFYSGNRMADATSWLSGRGAAARQPLIERKPGNFCF